jgi:hypothetical protein
MSTDPGDMDIPEGVVVYDDDPEETVDELQQHADDEVPALRVVLDGPAAVHELPARTAIMHQVTVGTSAVELFSRDLRRARALVWAHADTAALISVGTRQDEVQESTCAQLLAGQDDGTVAAQVLELKHCEPVWAKTATGTATVSYVLEQWAD